MRSDCRNIADSHSPVRNRQKRYARAITDIDVEDCASLLAMAYRRMRISGPPATLTGENCQGTPIPVTFYGTILECSSFFHRKGGGIMAVMARIGRLFKGFFG